MPQRFSGAPAARSACVSGARARRKRRVSANSAAAQRRATHRRSPSLRRSRRQRQSLRTAARASAAQPRRVARAGRGSGATCRRRRLGPRKSRPWRARAAAARSRSRSGAGGGAEERGRVVPAAPGLVRSRGPQSKSRPRSRAMAGEDAAKAAEKPAEAPKAAEELEARSCARQALPGVCTDTHRCLRAIADLPIRNSKRMMNSRSSMTRVRVVGVAGLGKRSGVARRVRRRACAHLRRPPGSRCGRRSARLAPRA